MYIVYIACATSLKTLKEEKEALPVLSFSYSLRSHPKEELWDSETKMAPAQHRREGERFESKNSAITHP